MNYEEFQINNCVFTITVSDILSRLAYPLIASVLRFPSRFVFLIGVFGLGVVRLIFLYMQMDNYILSLMVCMALGFFRALTVVNQVLVLCDFCEQNCPSKLPGTLGLSVVIKAIMLVIFGWTFHGICEISANLTLTFYSQIFLFLIVIIIWLVEPEVDLRTDFSNTWIWRFNKMFYENKN